MTPKLLQLLVFYIFFRYGHFVSHPFIALLLFLHHYSSFDYDTSTIDLDSAIHGYHEMITRDPTLEMKFQLRAQCTTTSVQTLIASCVGVSQETLDQKSEETNSEEHPKSKQHHPCTPQVLVEKFKSLLTEYRSRYEATLIAYTRIVEEPHLDASGNVPYRSDSQYPYYEDPHSGFHF